METKQIIVIIAVVALACAGIGAAYAYSAQLSTEQNTVESHHLVLDHTGDFNDKLSSDKIQYDSETTEQNKAIYTPYGAAPVVRDLIGTAVNTNDDLEIQHFNVTIDSSLMEQDNWFTFYVKTTEINGQVKDFAGAYAIVYTYNYDSNGDGNLDENDVPIKDYTILDGAGVTAESITNLYPMFTSPQRFASTLQNVDIDLYAVPYEGTIGQASPDYDGVAFQFYAITVASTPAQIGELITVDSTALTVKDKDGAEYTTGITASAYLQNHGRLAVAATESEDEGVSYEFANLLTSITGSDNLELTFSADEIADSKATGMIYKDISTGSGNVVKQVPASLSVTDVPPLKAATGTTLTFKIGDSKSSIESAIKEATIKAVYTSTLSADCESQLVFTYDVTTVDPAHTGTIAFDDDEEIKAEGTTLGFSYVTLSYTQDEVTVENGVWIKIVAAEA